MAHRDFDAEFDYEKAEGHTFDLGGYTFHTKPVAPPGAFLNAGRGLSAAVRFLRRLVVPEDRPNLERVLEMGDSGGRLLDLAPEFLAATQELLAAEASQDKKARAVAVDRLRQLAEQTAEPEEPGPMVSAFELDTAADWLMEVTIGRPLSSAGSSQNGDGRTSGGSKDGSRKAARVGKT